MQLSRLVLTNFQSFGPEPTTIEFDSRTFLLGPNGAGKTAVLHALSRMFGYWPEIRRVRESDFHRPLFASGDAVPDDADDDQAGQADDQEVAEDRSDVAALALTIEAHFAYEELEDDEELYPNVAPGFRHMSLIDPDGVPELRVRLTATLDTEGEIEEQISYITGLDDDGMPTSFAQMPRSDRALFQVHYLPARRDPAEHVRYTANSLVGRVLRSATWASELGDIETLSAKLSDVLGGHAAVGGLDSEIAAQWGSVHTGDFFTSPKLSFNAADVDGLLRHLTIDFQPTPTSSRAGYERLSDGQQSLLYISLVLAVQSLNRKAVAGALPGFDLHKLRPPVFVLVAVEEPENSLSPHHLGRVLSQLSQFAEQDDSQAVLATHSPALLRRVHPRQVRHLRLDGQRRTCVRGIDLPKMGAEAAKFVREAVQAFPELYFSRLVVLGEGDSEEIVLPRLFAAHKLIEDHVSISVVPLGGRHVNHFWRLLDGLGIPYITLLDLDAGRHNGGWGRIRYALTQYRLLRGESDGFAEEALEQIPEWDSEVRPDADALGGEILDQLEEVGVYFSSPLDLDYTLITAYAEAYDIDEDALAAPDAKTIAAVLGKQTGPVEDLYDDDEQALFEAYRSRFRSKSKPVSHLEALAQLTNKKLVKSLPEVYSRLIADVSDRLGELPE